MINRNNWKSVKEYLLYRREVHRVSVETCRLEEFWLRHVLEWADDTPFQKVLNIRPVFPKYMDDKGFSEIYKAHVLRSVRRFFEWCIKHQRGYSSLSARWLDTLRVRYIEQGNVDHQAVTYEEIFAIASAPVQTLGEVRIRASAVFWWLSGIRIGAFISLPTVAVDLDNLSIKQHPKLGVRTKKKKHATTYLLDIPELLQVVRDWDNQVRSKGSKYWFAHLSYETGEIDPSITSSGFHRDVLARRDLRLWLDRVGLKYYSPHVFRHGHAVYSYKKAVDVADLKAISQNLMHKDLKITSGTYAIFSELDVRHQITMLGKVKQNDDNQSLILLLRQLLKQLENTNPKA